jgi:hypothetical protein
VSAKVPGAVRASSEGGEGFFGRLDADGGIVCLGYLEFANSFAEIEVRDDQAVFRSASDVRISVVPDAAPVGVEGAQVVSGVDPPDPA